MTIQVREATEADLPSIAQIASAAFHPTTDAISRHLFPEHLKPADAADIGDSAYPWRLARKSAALKAFNGLNDGSKCFVAVDSDNDAVVGFSFWESPETESTEDEARQKLEAMKHWAPDPPPAGVDQEAFLELRKVVDGDAKVVFAQQKDKTWNLDYLGVDPKQQRCGIGRKLLEYGIAYIASVAAAEGDAAHGCYLVATAAGKGLYESSGFEFINELTIFGHLHHSMVRKVEASEKLRN